MIESLVYGVDAEYSTVPEKFSAAHVHNKKSKNTKAILYLIIITFYENLELSI